MSSSSTSDVDVNSVSEFEIDTDEHTTLVFEEEVTVVDNNKTIVDDEFMRSEISYLLISYHPNKKEYGHRRILNTKTANFAKMITDQEKKQSVSVSANADAAYISFPSHIVPAITFNKKVFVDVNEKEKVMYTYDDNTKIEDSLDKFLAALHKVLNSDHATSKQMSDRLFILLRPYESNSQLRSNTSTDAVYRWTNGDSVMSEITRIVSPLTGNDGDTFNVTGYYNVVSDDFSKTQNIFSIDRYIDHLLKASVDQKLQVFPHTFSDASVNTATVISRNGMVMRLKDNMDRIHIVDLEDVCSHKAMYYTADYVGYKFNKSLLLTDDIFFDFGSKATTLLRLVSLDCHEHIFALYNSLQSGAFASIDAIYKAIPDVIDGKVSKEDIQRVIDAAYTKTVNAVKKKVLTKRHHKAEVFGDFVTDVKVKNISKWNDTTLCRMHTILQSSYSFLLHNLKHISEHKCFQKAGIDFSALLAEIEHVVSLSKSVNKNISKNNVEIVFTSHQDMIKKPPRRVRDVGELHIDNFVKTLKAKETELGLLWDVVDERIYDSKNISHQLDKSYIKVRKDSKPIYSQTFFADYELQNIPIENLESLKKAVKKYMKLREKALGLINKDTETYESVAKMSQKYISTEMQHKVDVDYSKYFGDEEYMDWDEMLYNKEGFGMDFTEVLTEDDQQADDAIVTPETNTLINKIAMILGMNLTESDYNFVVENVKYYLGTDAISKKVQEMRKALIAQIGAKIKANEGKPNFNLHEFKVKALAKVQEQLATQQSKLMSEHQHNAVIFIFAVFTVFVQIKLPQVIINISLPFCKDKMSLDGFPMMDKKSGGITEYMACIIKNLSRMSPTFESFEKVSLQDVQQTLQDTIQDLVTNKEILRLMLDEARDKVKKNSKHKDNKDSIWAIYNEGAQFRPFTKPISSKNMNPAAKYISKMIEDTNEQALLKMGMNKAPLFSNACCLKAVKDVIMSQKEMSRSVHSYINDMIRYSSTRSVTTKKATAYENKDILKFTTNLIDTPLQKDLVPFAGHISQLIDNCKVIRNKAEIRNFFSHKEWTDLASYVESKASDIVLAFQQKQIDINELSNVIRLMLYNNDSLENYHDFSLFCRRFMSYDFLGTLSKVCTNYKPDESWIDKRKYINKQVRDVIKTVIIKDEDQELMEFVAGQDGIRGELETYDLFLESFSEFVNSINFPYIESDFNICLLSSFILVTSLEWLLYVAINNNLEFNASSYNLLADVQLVNTTIKLGPIAHIIKAMLKKFENKYKSNVLDVQNIRDAYEIQRESRKKKTMIDLESLPEEKRKMLKKLKDKGIITWDSALEMYNDNNDLGGNTQTNPTFDHSLHDDDDDDMNDIN